MYTANGIVLYPFGQILAVSGMKTLVIKGSLHISSKITNVPRLFQDVDIIGWLSGQQQH